MIFNHNASNQKCKYMIQPLEVIEVAVFLSKTECESRQFGNRVKISGGESHVVKVLVRIVI